VDRVGRGGFTEVSRIFSEFKIRRDSVVWWIAIEVLIFGELREAWWVGLMKSGQACVGLFTAECRR
jgi:hypothetical protein